jgi:hypothetical protein
MEGGMNGCGESADGKSFCEAGDTFEQDMAIGKQPNQQTIYQLRLADDDLADLGAQF